MQAKNPAPSMLLAVLLAVGFPGTQAASESTPMPMVLDLKSRAEVIDAWLAERVQTVLPGLMRRAGIDLWLVISREYNEDPVLKTMIPATWLSARRWTMLLIHDPGGDAPLETLAVARYDVGSVFHQAWDPQAEPDQWRRLAELVEERQPQRIGINVSGDFALADGLTHTEHQALVENLSPRYRERLVSAEALAIGWLETRTASEMVVYGQICAIAHRIIAEGLSEAAIQPGITTTSDLQWWYRERVADLKLATWFHPSVSIQRPDAGDDEPEIIQPGDLLHVDFGITYLRLNTDTQQHAYVLKPGETDAPEPLRRALATGNRLQDILTANFVTGRSGNEILAATRRQAIAEGIKPSIYTHPLGYHGHAAGPTIGLWDQQEGVPGNGDYTLYPNTAYSIELGVFLELPGWSKPLNIKLEEDAFFDGETVRYIDGRQTELHLIPRR
ncbi:MAG: M24 family metallopeptidase [Pseudomonadales bacterium]